jgi:phospholipid/cholesterol/gamma-HCH transport system substrate-binding protein
VKRRLQGLFFVVVLLAMAGLAIGSYAGFFSRGVPVTLKVDHIGTQLASRADVKVRGLNVGTVTSVSTDGSVATIELSLDRDKIGQIPRTVSARLIPKTLFGEKYVSLVPPSGPPGPPLAAGDVIPEDRSSAARELERVLDGLLPLLQAVKPQDLATTLGALSQALSGRGEELGRTLVQLQKLTGGLQPAVPDLQEDITQLADFAGNLNEAAPDLLDALEDLSVTSRTVVEQREQLHELLIGVTGASDDLTAFLVENRTNLIGLAASSRPTLESLARYAPEFPCFFGQLAGLVPRVDEAFGVGTDRPGLRITLEIAATKGKYVPGEEPRYRDDRGPRCYPIRELGPQQLPGGPFEDGSKPSPPPVGTPMGDEDVGLETFGTAPASYPGPAGYTGMGVPNSPGEQQIVAELTAAREGSSPDAVPGWSSMLVGPLYRGAEVTLT